MYYDLDDHLESNLRYQKLRDLNSGTFGFVQLCRDRLANDLVAIKFIDRGDKITKYVESEIQNHRELIHPHIVQFREVFLTPKHLCIVMEFAEGGDMFEYVVKKGGLIEDDARWFFQQIIVALDYCHKKKIINRDVKLENTLLDGNPRPLVKLCDFGYSKHMKYQSEPHTRVGTPAYLAPEVIKARHGLTYDGEFADLWSCGVMLYVMLVGAYPFERPEDKHDPHKLQKMIQRILKVEYDISPQFFISEPCKDLLSKILVENPQKRISISQIQQHPWYIQDLPPGVLEMNEQVLNGSANYLQGLQTVEDIQQILREARCPSNTIQELNMDNLKGHYNNKFDNNDQYNQENQYQSNIDVSEGLISQELNQH